MGLHAYGAERGAPMTIVLSVALAAVLVLLLGVLDRLGVIERRLDALDAKR